MEVQLQVSSMKISALLQAISTASLSQFNPLNTVSSNSLENILGDNEPFRSGALLSPTQQTTSPSLSSSPELRISRHAEVVEGQVNAKEQAPDITELQEALLRDSDAIDQSKALSSADGATISEGTAQWEASPFTTATTSDRDAEVPEAAERIGIEELQENEASPLSTPAESPLLARAERLLWAQIQNPHARLFKVSDLEQNASPTEEHLGEPQELIDEKQEVSSKTSVDLEATSSRPVKDPSHASPR